ncbi:MAG: hypothetical protein WBD22_11965, partial [Pyrinomonadaceae bacterium]
KRPFFLEGADIFQSPSQVFYSRTIIDPDVAVKLTGKIGKTSFGILAASDNAPGNYDENERNNPLIRPRINEFLDKNATFAVLRLKQDFGKENNIGFFATYRGFPEQNNLVSAIDGRFKFSPKLTSSVNLIGTHSRRCFFDPSFDPQTDPAGAARNGELCGGGTYGDITVSGNPFQRYRTGIGVGYYWNLDFSEKNRGWFIEAGGRSKDYRADAGFTRRTNTNFLFFMYRLSTESKPKSKIIQANWRQFSGINYDWKGRLQEFNLGTNVGLNLQRNTSVRIETGIFNERLFEEEFGLKRTPTRAGAFVGSPTRGAWQHYISGNMETTPLKRVSFGLFLGHIYNAFDFDFGSPQQDPGPGRQFDAELWGEIKPIDPLRISLSYRKSRLVRLDDNRRAFDADLVTLRSTYQFTRFLFTRLRVDYDSNGQEYNGQALIGWTPSPGTAFYAGYNDNFTYSGFNPYTRQPEPGFARDSRTFFIRMTYLFRKSF